MGDDGLAFFRRRAVRIAVRALAALTIAALGAGLGSWLGWRDQPRLPNDSAAMELADAVVGSGTAVVTERQEAEFGYDHPEGWTTTLLGDDDYVAGYAQLLVQDSGDPADLLTAVHDRLSDLGWRVEWGSATDEVTAVRDRLSIIVYPVAADGGALTEASSGQALAIEISRAEPGRVWPLTVAGYAFGLIAGWLLAGWTLAGITAGRGRRTVLRKLALVTGCAGLGLMLPGTVLATGDLIFNAVAVPETALPAPVWGGYLFFGVRALTNLALVFLAATLVLIMPAPRVLGSRASAVATGGPHRAGTTPSESS